MSDLTFYTCASFKTSEPVMTFGDSKAALDFMRDSKEPVYLFITCKGAKRMTEQTNTTETEVKTKAPKKAKEPKVKKEPGTPGRRGSGLLDKCRALLDSHAAAVADGTMTRKDVIKDLVENHGVNKGTANVQYGIKFGTKPRAKAE